MTPLLPAGRPGDGDHGGPESGAGVLPLPGRTDARGGARDLSGAGKRPGVPAQRVAGESVHHRQTSTCSRVWEMQTTLRQVWAGPFTPDQLPVTSPHSRLISRIFHPEANWNDRGEPSADNESEVRLA